MKSWPIPREQRKQLLKHWNLSTEPSTHCQWRKILIIMSGQFQVWENHKSRWQIKFNNSTVHKPITVGRILNARFFLLRIASFYARRNQKNCRKKNTQWIIVHIPRPFCSSVHAAIANMHALSISRVFDILTYMYIQLSIVENESSSILQANCRPANTEPSATVTQTVYMVFYYRKSSNYSATLM